MPIVALDSDSVRTSPSDWQSVVKAAIRDSNVLRQRLGLSADDCPETKASNEQFRTFVPEPFFSRIRPSDPNDPLLKQVLTVSDEQALVPGFSHDAVGDQNAERSAGLIHKYQGRVLLITRGVCAIHCRYCFRRHFPYDQGPVSIQQFDETLQTVRDDASIEEVILSGGDPLMMVDRQLQQLIAMIEAIPHVSRLRIHTRLPMVIPSRVTAELQAMLRETRLAKFVVVHANHPNEIDDEVLSALQKLNECQATVLNQAVLLKGVNDDASVLIELSRRLIAAQCIPYYLHQLDRVQGAAHFEVDVEVGKRLIAEMQTALPGYAVPRYVQEIAGELSKTVLE